MSPGGDTAFSFATVPYAPEVSDLAITEDGGLCVSGSSLFIGYGQTNVDQYVPGPARLFRITDRMDLDRAFADGGTLVVADTFGGTSVAAGPENGCMIAAGESFDETLYQVSSAAVLRVDSAGALVWRATVDHGPAPEQVVALAAASDGGVFALSATGTEVWALKFEADGALDEAWGDGGEVLLPFVVDCVMTSFCGWGDLAVLADGSVLAAMGHPVGVARLDPGGALDLAYGAGGLASGTGTFRAVAVDADPLGAAVLVGNVVDDGAFFPHPVVERLDPAGALDLPATPVPFDAGADMADVAVDDLGRIWLSGRIDDTPGAMRLGADGMLDLTWGDGGVVLDPPGTPSYAQFDTVVLRPDGFAVVVGEHGGQGKIIGRMLPE